MRSLYWYYLHYCYAEGLNGSSDQAKALLMFLFYGTYLYRDKETPIIHAIRKSVVSGRYRFNISRHTKAYELFDKALDDHPEWQVFLDDMGTGKAPPEYNVMIEKVLRLVAVDDIFSLGSKSLASRESWVDPAHDWRKREVSGFRTGANCVCTGANCVCTGVDCVCTGANCARTGVILTLTLLHVHANAVVPIFREKTSQVGKLQILGQI